MNSGDPFAAYHEAMVEYRWDQAEAKRMQRTEADVTARDRQLARAIVRCVLARIIVWKGR